MNEEEKYVFRHYSRFMTLTEHAASRNFFFQQKLAQSQSASEGYRNTLESKQIRKPEVLKLMDGGYENFKRNVAQRILAEHSDQIFFNRCPNCNKLVRTPLAKQCNHCFHKWHSSE